MHFNLNRRWSGDQTAAANALAYSTITLAHSSLLLIFYQSSPLWYFFDQQPITP
jgi:hypothetical protein